MHIELSENLLAGVYIQILFPVVQETAVFK